jgi:sugar/nucleoside kinase (ribokinase family)
MDEIRLPAYKVPIVDSTGCGDAYCAGFIVGLSLGWDRSKRVDSVRRGQSGHHRTRLDAGIVNLEKTIEFMNSQEIAPMTV